MKLRVFIILYWTIISKKKKASLELFGEKNLISYWVDIKEFRKQGHFLSLISDEEKVGPGKWDKTQGIYNPILNNY